MSVCENTYQCHPCVLPTLFKTSLREILLHNAGIFSQRNYYYTQEGGWRREGVFSKNPIGNQVNEKNTNFFLIRYNIVGFLNKGVVYAYSHRIIF